MAPCPRRSAWQGAGGLLLALLGAVALAGCAQHRPTTIPLQRIDDRTGCPVRGATLVVMLPGAYSAPGEFVDEGFVAALRQRGLRADVSIVDAHLGYFADRSALQRLREDVVAPARAAGYGKVWLVGISLGGFAALGYAARHGDEIDGVLAIAPYPGPVALLDEIRSAGGPRAWQRTTGVVQETELDRDVWRWLGAANAATRRPPVYLGHGRDDRFADGLVMMATALPDGHAVTVPGGHDWAAWRAVWTGWLERGLLGSSCVRSESR